PINVPDLEPGDYTLVAWCGLDNSHEDATRAESFLVSDTEIGVTTRQELICRMEREIYPDGTHHSSEQLFDLYHGTAYGITIYDPKTLDGEGDHIYTINLTKDTNNVRVMLQQMNKDVDVNKFTFCIEEANGTLGSDNDLQEDENINYEPFHTDNGVAGTVEGTTRADGAIEGLGVAIADLKMSRLMARHKSVLTIKNTDGTRVLQIPMTDYALLAKPFEAEGFTDQEYLDRQDNYRLMFFLDSQGEWMSSRVYINSWAVINQEGSLK
ncbi:MAG: FimB/Mfa2 family fimbrial subunit, partial [Muribaculaceae bacterium]|nr:FimB/Mfa2 family fimbrial subunit [Muribaculaceae bacterium]